MTPLTYARWIFISAFVAASCLSCSEDGSDERGKRNSKPGKKDRASRNDAAEYGGEIEDGPDETSPRPPRDSGSEESKAWESTDPNAGDESEQTPDQALDQGVVLDSDACGSPEAERAVAEVREAQKCFDRHAFWDQEAQTCIETSRPNKACTKEGVIENLARLKVTPDLIARAYGADWTPLACTAFGLKSFGIQLYRVFADLPDPKDEKSRCAQKAWEDRFGKKGKLQISCFAFSVGSAVPEAKVPDCLK